MDRVRRPADGRVRGIRLGDGPARAPRRGRSTHARLAALLAGVFAVGVILAAPTAAASSESQYISNLVGYLNEAAGYLTQARAALDACLGNWTACTANSQPYRDQVEAARLDVEDVAHRVGLLSPPSKYVQIQSMALESLANISTALGLLNLGLEQVNASYISNAGLHLDSARLEIQAIYDEIVAMPPTADTGAMQILWAVIAGLVVLVGVNTLYSVRTRQRDVRNRKKESSTCPDCGAVMADYTRYPLKTVVGWMATHRSTYHPRESHPAR